jgi:hypothetical protein
MKRWEKAFENCFGQSEDSITKEIFEIGYCAALEDMFKIPPTRHEVGYDHQGFMDEEVE